MRLELEGHLVDPARAALHPTTVRQGEAGGIGVIDLALRHHDHELGVRHRQRTELGGDRTRKAFGALLATGAGERVRTVGEPALGLE